MTLTDPAVALTDWALAAECALFAGLLLRDAPGNRELQHWFALLFASLCAASLLGGMVHGLFADESSRAHALLWPAVLLAIGSASLAGWMLAAHLLLPPGARRVIRWLAWTQLAVLAWVVARVSQQFWIAIAIYLPATSLLLVGFARAWWRSRTPQLGWGTLGLVLTFLAAALQQRRIGLHPVYFDHNALYHGIQGIGLLGIFLAARDLVRAKPC